MFYRSAVSQDDGRSGSMTTVMAGFGAAQKGQSLSKAERPVVDESRMDIET